MEDIKHAIDAISIGTWLATIVGLLPVLSTLAALIWMCFRICETYQSYQVKKLERRKLEQELNDQQSKT